MASFTKKQNRFLREWKMGTTACLVIFLKVRWLAWVIIEYVCYNMAYLRYA